jgi:hypothetical protein
VTKATRSDAGKPAPAALRKAIKDENADIDFDALWHWYENHCPKHLRGMAPDLAAILSTLPPLTRWAGAGLVLNGDG